MKRNTTTSLLSLLAVLSLIGLGLWVSFNRSTPQTASQPAQGVPLDSPLAVLPATQPVPTSLLNSPLVAQPIEAAMAPVIVITGTYPVYPTFEPELLPTFDYDSVIYEPTATLTQKEELVYDGFNGITITLQAGLYAQLPRPDLPGELRIGSVDLGNDPRTKAPDDWIFVSMGVGQIFDGISFEQFAHARYQNEVNPDPSTGSLMDLQYGELEPFNLNQYHGYAFLLAGVRLEAFKNVKFIKSRIIYLPLDAGRFVQIIVHNIDSPDFPNLMQSLNTLEFAPAIPIPLLPVATELAISSEVKSLSTDDPNSQVLQPTATLTQKEEVVFDPVNGITITLQPGLYRRLLVTEAGANLYFRNFATREDIQEGWPANWIIVMLDVRAIPAGADLEQIAAASHQNEINASQYQESRFEYGAMEPIQLGLYHGYTYKSSGQDVDAPFAHDQTIDLLLADGHYAHIHVSNTDSTDFAKVMMSLGTLQFAPPALTP